MKAQKIGHLCRSKDIDPLEAVILVNDGTIEHLFAENRCSSKDDLLTREVCSRYDQRKHRKSDDGWKSLYMIREQLDDLRSVKYSELCRYSELAERRYITVWVR